MSIECNSCETENKTVEAEHENEIKEQDTSSKKATHSTPTEEEKEPRFLTACLRYGILPWLSHLLLVRKRRKLEAHWKERINGLSRFIEENNEIPTDEKKDGEAGILAVWVNETEKQCVSGLLSKEKAAAFRVLVPLGWQEEQDKAQDNGRKRSQKQDRTPIRTDAEDAQSYNSIPNAVERIIADVLVIATVAIPAFCGANVLTLVMIFAAAVILSIAALCDCKAHVIPFELSYCLYPIGAILSFSVGGLHGFLTGCGLSILLYGIILISKYAVGLQGSKTSIGGGDLRTLPAMGLLCGMNGTAFAIAATLFVLVIQTIITRIAKTNWNGCKTRLPMGPAIAIGSCIGMMFSIL